MAAIDDKIKATKLIIHTPKTFEEVRALGLEAASIASGTVTKINETSVTPNEVIQYNVKRLGMVQVMNFGLIFNKADEGDNTVLLIPGNYLTSQATFLVFIPIGPKDAAGYPPLKRFSDHIKASLS
ncbi:hypothetical protein [Arthrobacter bambusae]|uniref:Uncharacterized protein n=1 Tax=Arthrobacter bambusae TaxID=1338426 RepID=A0AAW8DB72_9MICC|nr:hypothetical protein [Arthrobacter bambusae]MDP9905602.1 hypothetical protein [Arthrobacter bambusae]MDQ0127316.1 hypothetical protein [Arthrobacter bambusae]MDQ0178658.1 hypothetical protein [Arthrobacter bambusae]